MRKIRVGMIGAGIHATNMLYPSVVLVDDLIERVAVCDLDESKARKAAKDFGFDRVYVDYRDMLEKSQLDAVIICIGAKQHPGVVIDCLEAGVDVMVEKPAALTPEDAYKVVEVQRKVNKFVFVDHQKRHGTPYVMAKKVIKEKFSHGISMMETKMHGRPYETLFNCLMEWQIHNIDLVRFFADDDEIVYVKAIQNRISELRAAIAVLIQFKSGLIATLNWGTEGGYGSFCERFEAVEKGGSQGVIVENAWRFIYYHLNHSEIWEPDWQPITRNLSYVVFGYEPGIREFAECVVRREYAPKPTMEDEAKALEVVYQVAEQLNIPKDWRPVVCER